MDHFQLQDVTQILPHRGDSILIDQIVEQGPESILVSLVVGESPWLSDAEGRVAPWVSIEYMAQAVAAFEGLMAAQA
ncbi:3-hydroxylacyl-ACP dehydratase, partial [Myxococcota bacterium]|nr:3-hydroxylacyl-ACP dehydratase [Myxococcota bacterium]